MLSYDLKMIKDKYGEKMMHFCRTLFPSLLEQEGLLFKILSEHFDYNRSLYDDIKEEFVEEEFKDYIYSFVDVETEKVKSAKTPKELLEEAGYDLYECHSEDDIQSFSKYYAEDEIICTITFGGRLNRCFVFFAVKKDVDKIKRTDFTTPKREDEYGTSVISIQFTRGEINTLSIKNRYNHTVNNPDATFSNNLENIIPGLTDAFEREYGLNIDSNKREFALDSYVIANDGKFYKFNYEINNVYYCANNVIIDNFEVKRLDKAKYILADYYIIDKVNKTISLHDDKISDSFTRSIGKINRIEETVDKATNNRSIIINNSIIIEMDRDNRIVKFVNNEIEFIEDDFMFYNKFVQVIEIPNVKRIKDNFMRNNFSLRKFSSSELVDVGNGFLKYNFGIEDAVLPNLISVGDDFLKSASFPIISFPNLKYIGDHFMTNCSTTFKLDLPKVEIIGNNFLDHNAYLLEINMPKLIKVGNSFLRNNESINHVYLPLLRTVGHYFLGANRGLEELKLESLEEAGIAFLRTNEMLKSISLPRLLSVGNDFMLENISVTEVDFPNLEEIGSNFMMSNKAAKEVNLVRVKKIGGNFMYSNNAVTKVRMDEVEDIEEEGFLNNSTRDNLTGYFAPKYYGFAFDFVMSRNYHKYKS
ncbi:MAG: hypothetical protein IKF36_03125 [Bacilli bacterium]|nr:hypothetical protein [Bacilli bacterium]